MRVLLVEDEAELRESLRRALAEAGFAVDVAGDGESGEFLGSTENYDLAILDLGLPRLPGLEVLQRWRESGNDLPVLILTARDAWHERVDGFKAGADDYLGKPFHVEELIVRLLALAKRRHGHAPTPLETQSLRLDEERQCVVIEGVRTESLTSAEFRLLRCFMLHPGKIMSKSQLAEHLYPSEDDPDSNVIEVYINRLRRKLGRNFIETRRGQGYVFGSQP